ncbi:MAG TPA: thiamine pyrophosphate-dependent enzyme [Syntrophales bacterium]|nr:thiamine pyrophosphate-dependent enzyme [Syntrophales bacterium]HPX11385.1 thiamine pyrophosphate-dependent enzyme [Syntrophales bacterium]HQN78618.1 thiamine pyrophosphate-dependent enzyme [Syntrophales bacterium]HQQ27301.1 thiamine pyrophosphate-dependent enzyme [Syntrophales bacterium]
MEKKVFERPRYLKKASTHYCPGCGHSILHRLVAEVIGELGIGERTIGVPPAGCAVLAYDYIDVDMGEAPHGRGAALATGIKRVLPDRIVFSYQGDGDIAAIGTAETIHAANRGERITVIFVNNGCYGMTGGQMAPTTVTGQLSTTTPGGRVPLRDGYPVDLSEMLAVAKGTVYIERTSVTSPKNILRTKRAITKAFRTQIDGLGFSLVEVLSPCPTNWKLSPVEAARWAEETMTKTYPLKVIKDLTGTPGQDGN